METLRHIMWRTEGIHLQRRLCGKERMVELLQWALTQLLSSLSKWCRNISHMEWMGPVSVQLMLQKKKKQKNSVALVCKQLYRLSDRRLSAKLVPTFADESVTWSVQRIPTAVNLSFLDPEPLLFRSSSSSVVLTRLSGPRLSSIIIILIWLS
jgi:hypothetical protein